jgi:hypothetical protein
VQDVGLAYSGPPLFAELPRLAADAFHVKQRPRTANTASAFCCFRARRFPASSPRLCEALGLVVSNRLASTRRCALLPRFRRALKRLPTRRGCNNRSAHSCVPCTPQLCPFLQRRVVRSAWLQLTQPLRLCASWLWRSEDATASPHRTLQLHNQRLHNSWLLRRRVAATPPHHAKEDPKDRQGTRSRFAASTFLFTCTLRFTALRYLCFRAPLTSTSSRAILVIGRSTDEIRNLPK